MRTTIAALILAGAALAATGCGGSHNTGPAIPDSLVVSALVDVYMATAKAHLEGTDPDSARAEAMHRFGLDTAALNQTLDYFAHNPDSAASVYQQALDSLVVTQRGLRSGPELDSLTKRIRG